MRLAITGSALYVPARGPLSARIRVGLERILGTPVLQAYGTTETGTIAANPPVGLRKPETVGFSPDNDFAIMDASGKVVGPGIEGEIVVRGPTVFGGYENDPAANRSIFRDGWYRTGDQGIIDADGYARLIGRLDEMINRGGEKIAPREIDEALLTHDDVAQAVSFPIPHATLHQELASVVVLQSDALVTADELRRFVGQRLAPFKVPRIILCAAEIPKGPTGKLNRRDMAAYFGLDGEPQPKLRYRPKSRKCC
jgi:oxalate---CoA ligase